MLNLMAAEILIFDPVNVGPATAALTALGFRIKVRKDMIDDGEPTVFIRATGFTEHSLATFLDWMLTIVYALGGDVWDADIANADIAGADQVEIDQMTAPISSICTTAPAIAPWRFGGTSQGRSPRLEKASQAGGPSSLALLTRQLDDDERGGVGNFSFTAGPDAGPRSIDRLPLPCCNAPSTP
jgi:hypothetical protein